MKKGITVVKKAIDKQAMSDAACCMAAVIRLVFFTM